MSRFDPTVSTVSASWTINCQRLTLETWQNDEEVSLHRGLAAMRQRLPAPLWIIQRADQGAECWPLIGEAPIFTEHAAAQFGWMIEASFDRQDSQRRYAQDSGLVLAPTLEEKCAGFQTCAMFAYHGRVRCDLSPWAARPCRPNR